MEVPSQKKPSYPNPIGAPSRHRLAGARLTHAAPRALGRPAQTKVQRTFNRRGARAKAQSSPPCSFYLVSTPQHAQSHPLKRLKIEHLLSCFANYRICPGLLAPRQPIPPENMTDHNPIKPIICRLLLAVSGPLLGQARPAEIAFSQSTPTAEAYDFVEVTLNVSGPDARNPFTDVTVQGHFERTSGADRVSVTGFCDASDGSAFRIRFMPAVPGEYTYDVTYRQGTFETTHQGRFNATAARRRGPVRVDSQYPWHFLWEGTGEHHFFGVFWKSSG